MRIAALSLGAIDVPQSYDRIIIGDTKSALALTEPTGCRNKTVRFVLQLLVFLTALQVIQCYSSMLVKTS